MLSAIFSALFFLLGYHFLPALSNVTTTMVGASGAIKIAIIAPEAPTIVVATLVSAGRKWYPNKKIKAEKIAESI